jgi:divalent metal cation (Fe/Co/Zn/Cd) transporter
MKAQSTIDKLAVSIEKAAKGSKSDILEDYEFQKVPQTHYDGENHSDEIKDDNLEGKAKFATTASWIVNWFLFFVKLVVAILSSSKAVLAALVDSAVDLISQGILSLAELYMSRHNPDYPIGRSRLEAISVLACAFIMCMASVEVIQFSIVDLYNGFSGQIPKLEVGLEMYCILGVGIALKVFLYVYCVWAKTILKSDMLEALAEDHFNDVISNSVAIVTAAIAFHYKAVW